MANTAGAAAALQLASYIDKILSAAIAGTGHQLAGRPSRRRSRSRWKPTRRSAPATGPTCRDDATNGWDFDAATRRIVFFGACIPSAAGKKVAVSYRFWNDGSPDKGGDPCNNTCAAPKACDPSSAMAICPRTAAGPAPARRSATRRRAPAAGHRLMAFTFEAEATLCCSFAARPSRFGFSLFNAAFAAEGLDWLCSRCR
ncbi:MAG: hypothetical protein IPJ65_38935 [Archangiaceae bacterium]|nr:hypothetical protein [Archangiaceae bacterium]